MPSKVGYHWHLRRLMAEAGMFATTDLVPLLADRGVRLSREQVYRLVVRVPERSKPSGGGLRHIPAPISVTPNFQQMFHLP